MDNTNDNVVDNTTKESKIDQDINIRRQEIERKRQEQQRDYQVKQMEKRLHYLHVLTETRDLEEKAFGQDEVIKSIKREASIKALRSCGVVSEFAVIDYLIKSEISTEDEQKRFIELQKKADEKLPDDATPIINEEIKETV